MDYIDACLDKSIIISIACAVPHIALEKILLPILLKAEVLRREGLKTLKLRTESLKTEGIVPMLKVLLVGDNSASVIYTNNKKKYVESFGGLCHILKINKTIKEKEFLNIVQHISKDSHVHGILIQLPLPKGPLSSLVLGPLVPPSKDVDGFHPVNFHRLVVGDNSALLPCTPKGVISLLEYYNISLESKNIAVIGRSMIVGKPLAALLTNKNATVTLCHSGTKALEDITKRCDIIISAVGKENFLGKKHIGNNRPVVVDVGMNRNHKGQVCGDVNFDEVAPLTSAITPVPGGVGPMTVHSLAQNLLQATEGISSVK